MNNPIVFLVVLTSLFVTTTAMAPDGGEQQGQGWWNWLAGWVAQPVEQTGEPGATTFEGTVIPPAPSEIEVPRPRLPGEPVPLEQEKAIESTMESIFHDIRIIEDPTRPIRNIETAQKVLEEHLKWIRKQLKTMQRGSPNYARLRFLVEQVQETLGKLASGKIKQKAQPQPSQPTQPAPIAAAVAPETAPQQPSAELSAEQRLVDEAANLVLDLRSILGKQERYIRSDLGPAIEKIIENPESDFAHSNYNTVIQDFARVQSNFEQQTKRLIGRAQELVKELTIPGAERQPYDDLIKLLNGAIAQQTALQETLINYRSKLENLLYQSPASLRSQIR